MKLSQEGIDLIKKYEGCRLTAYKPVPTEKYYTIGYGHYGPDVPAGATITQAEAINLLKGDLVRFENAVNTTGRTWTQPQFDALVSFSYNCGSGNLRKLIDGRTPAQIADALLSYNKGGGKALAGLTRRRQEERQMFLKGSSEIKKQETIKPQYKPLKFGDRGAEVKYLQERLISRGYSVGLNGADGDFGVGTLKGLLDYIRDTKQITVSKEIYNNI